MGIVVVVGEGNAGGKGVPFGVAGEVEEGGPDEGGGGGDGGCGEVGDAGGGGVGGGGEAVVGGVSEGKRGLKKGGMGYV